MNLQYFGEKGLEKQKSSSLRKGIRKLQEEIDIHERKIANPQDYYEDWDTFSDRDKELKLGHWKHEIDNFNNSIQNRLDELKKRGEE